MRMQLCATDHEPTALTIENTVFYAIKEVCKIG